MTYLTFAILATVTVIGSFVVLLAIIVWLSEMRDVQPGCDGHDE